MAIKIFYSWQSDLESRVTRGLIQQALQDAVTDLKLKGEIALAERSIEIDEDTREVGGSPEVAQTILDKISAANVFIGDLTYVALRKNGGGIPNPNVLIEYGWATKALGRPSILAVMNTAYGHPNDAELPFDIRHIRRPIPFSCPSDADPETRAAARKALSKLIAGALTATLAGQIAAEDVAATALARDAAHEAINELAFAHHRGGFPSIVPGPRLTVRLAPFASAKAPELSSRVVMRELRAHAFEERGVEEDSDDDQWWISGRRYETEMPNPEIPWRLRVAGRGMIEYQMQLCGARATGEGNAFKGYWLEALLDETLLRMASLAVSLGLVGRATLVINLEGVAETQLIGPERAGRMLRRAEIVVPPIEIVDLQQPQRDAYALDRVWRLGGWPDGRPDALSFDEEGASAAPSCARL